MDTLNLARQMIDFCRKGQFAEAQAALYAPHAVSVEPGNQLTEGLDAIQGKGKHFADTFDVHGCEVSEPLVAGDYFAVTIKIDVTHKESQQRFPMEEIAVYKVEGGKIVMEQFFFPGEPG